ncbi:hypothetical protein HYS95_03685 [Candidatus Daviesbacteria bacterium]|nr:hypothetical protein [Candidatus Daviesbacteria bacterium]
MDTENLTTNQRLMADNYSPLAAVKIEKWRQMRDEGKLFVVGACSDARLILPEMAYHIRTISATGPRSAWHEVLNYSKVQGIVIMDHFDCGGLKAKESISGKEVAEEGALEYVRDHVWATDPVKQSILTASWTASRTHLPVLAVVQDHHDGSLYIQGAFKNSDQIEYKTIPTYLLTEKELKEDIYKNGRPQLREELVPSVFSPGRKEVTDRALALINSSAGFADSQSIQDPEFVSITDELKPAIVRFPHLFGNPNTLFQVSLSTRMLNEADLDNKDVNDAFGQMHYPISHCIENQGQSFSAFQNTRVLYIETAKMEVSRRLATLLMRKSWVKDWLGLPGREIVVAEIVAGRIQEIDRAA